MNFTEAALRLEGKRDKLIQGVAKYGRPTSLGVAFEMYAYGMGGEGIAYLLGDLALLEAPPQLRPIKDALLTIYRLEVDAVAGHGECTSWGARSVPWGVTVECGGYANLVLPLVTRDNVVSVIADGEGTRTGWTAAQLLRAKTYDRWREVVEGVGIDLTGYPYNRLK